VQNITKKQELYNKFYEDKFTAVFTSTHKISLTEGEDVNCSLSLLTANCAEMCKRKRTTKCQQLFFIRAFYSEDHSFDCLSSSLLRYKLSYLILCFLLGNSPASQVYMPTFRNILFHLPSQVCVE